METKLAARTVPLTSREAVGEVVPIPTLPEPDGDTICELMPMISPCLLRSGPPEFPGLIAASV